MKQDYNHSTVGPPSPRSEKNFRSARSHRLDVGGITYEWKFWTGRFVLVPRYESVVTELMFEGVCRWTRIHWLTFGCSKITRGEREA